MFPDIKYNQFFLYIKKTHEITTKREQISEYKKDYKQ